MMWMGHMPAMMKVCHLDLPSTEKLPQSLQWADSLLLQCLQDLPQGSNQGQALSKQLPGKTKHSRGTRAWQFLPSLKLLYEQTLHQCSPLGWLSQRLSQSCTRKIERSKIILRIWSFILCFQFPRCQTCTGDCKFSPPTLPLSAL